MLRVPCQARELKASHAESYLLSLYLDFKAVSLAENRRPDAGDRVEVSSRMSISSLTRTIAHKESGFFLDSHIRADRGVERDMRRLSSVKDLAHQSPRDRDGSAASYVGLRLPQPEVQAAVQAHLSLKPRTLRVLPAWQQDDSLTRLSLPQGEADVLPERVSSLTVEVPGRVDRLDVQATHNPLSLSSLKPGLNLIEQRI